MDLKERIASIFPDEQSLPTPLTAGFPVEQKEYCSYCRDTRARLARGHATPDMRISTRT